MGNIRLFTTSHIRQHPPPSALFASVMAFASAGGDGCAGIAARRFGEEGSTTDGLAMVSISMYCIKSMSKFSIDRKMAGSIKHTILEQKGEY